MKPAAFESIVKRWNSVLSNTEFRVRDYSEVAGDARSGDFVYLDPPYANSHNRYSEDLDIARFLGFLDELNKKSVLWALSFDGIRGRADLTYALPKELYQYHTTLPSGHSAVQKVLNQSLERVEESLYLNYIPGSSATAKQSLLF